MAKTKEELKELKTKYESLTNKLKGLSEDELKQITGGYDPFEKLDGMTNQDVSNPRHSTIDINGLEAIGPYALDDVSKDPDYRS